MVADIDDSIKRKRFRVSLKSLAKLDFTETLSKLTLVAMVTPLAVFTFYSTCDTIFRPLIL